MVKIMVVEDNLELNRLFCTVLNKNGYHAIGTKDGQQALKLLGDDQIDLVVCDVMMPGMDGFSLTRTIRAAQYTMPILMVTARGAFADKEEGFIAGVDDYMVKPVDVEEMVLRIGALLRRAKISQGRRIDIGEVQLDYDSLMVKGPHEEVLLPLKEFNLLYKLLSFPGQIFTRQQLMDEFWGVDSNSDERTIDVHISRLRERFRGWEGFEISTVRGLGYRAVRR